MKDIKNGLLGVLRDAFLKLISVFDYRDENKLQEVCKKCVCSSLIESFINN
jgi:hypothetical protein